MRSGVEAIQDSSYLSDRWSGPFLVDDKHKVIYCGLEKVASSSWKMILMQLSGHVLSDDHWHDADHREIHLKSVLREVGIRGLQEYTAAEITHRLANYTKFLFVRHPVDRLLSAFRDKFEKAGPGSYFYQRYGSDIINGHRQLKSEDEVLMVSFAELVRFITEHHVFDPHWDVYYEVCLPCFMNYTYVGHMENFVEDVSYILKAVFGAEFKNFPQINIINKQRRNILSQYLHTLSASELKSLNEVYDIDMQIFGYHHITENGNISMISSLHQKENLIAEI
ncbi:hypothetical protein CAPTEDRAFT_124835 [Capitella teleta]|uniref:Carbohydrate sulfotransferase n=1 Tax=Capitella teleta TaxID=283909 RepID=R7TXK7_CAPTE|nr:hypothetical protein CAPTEDRAFT_124835 [Capitella teleta]|eukprot:ELT98469.1 hypothetical protein CAPTEDRAFT_124835 [Capitella teleta]